MCNAMTHLGCPQVDAIEKLAMLNTRDVRTIMHVLFQQGYLWMQELPRTTDRTPSKTVFLYHVNFDRSLTQLRRDLCTAAGMRLSLYLTTLLGFSGCSVIRTV